MVLAVGIGFAGNLPAKPALMKAPPKGMVPVQLSFGTHYSPNFHQGFAPAEPRQADAWANWGNLPIGLMDHMGATSATRQYIVGGLDVSWLGSAQLYENDPVNPGVWTTLTPMPFDLCNGAAALIGDTLYVCGGYTANQGTPLDTLLKYSISGGNWTTAPGPYASGDYAWSPAAVACAGKLYLISGCPAPGASGQTNQVWAYTPGVGWAAAANMNQGRVFAQAVVYHDTIWVSGGAANNAAINHTEFYAPTTNTWVVNAALWPTPPAADARWGTNGCVPVGTTKAVYYGGADMGFAICTTVSVFDFTSRTWSTEVPTGHLVYRTVDLGNQLYQAVNFGGSTGGFTPSLPCDFEAYAPPVDSDAAVTAIIDPGLMEIAGSVTPQATVANVGLQPLPSFQVRMTIGAYTNDQPSGPLAPGASVTLSFAPWTATPGTFAVKCSPCSTTTCATGTTPSRSPPRLSTTTRTSTPRTVTTPRSVQPARTGSGATRHSARALPSPRPTAGARTSPPEPTRPTA